MKNIITKRQTAKIEGSFVVFMIGMRINRFWKFWKWFPVAAKMTPMLKSLLPDKEKGLLHMEVALKLRGPVMIQYWRSFEHLEKFARSKEEPHFSAWMEYYKKYASEGSAGIWHETYTVEPGKYEAIYSNMPLFGLAKAGRNIEVNKTLDSAKERLSAIPQYQA